MADINEEIVVQYLKLVEGWFCMSDILFPVPGGYSNIDILAYNPKSRKYYDIEVKYRSAFSATEKNKKGKDVSKKSLRRIINQFANPQRDSKIKSLTKGKKAVNLLITTKTLLGKSDRKRNKMEEVFSSELKKKGYPFSKIKYFEEIIPKLYNKVELRGRHDTELLQSMRMIKAYKLGGK